MESEDVDSFIKISDIIDDEDVIKEDMYGNESEPDDFFGAWKGCKSHSDLFLTGAHVRDPYDDPIKKTSWWKEVCNGK